jgi:SAM-dependent methyltransferase
MNYASFNPSYQGVPPWEIDKSQPAVVTLVKDGQFRGQVLDVGCGTGENALHLISEQATGPFPSITSAEIVDAFDHQWINAKIQHAAYAVTTGEVPAWLVSIQRR